MLIIGITSIVLSGVMPYVVVRNMDRPQAASVEQHDEPRWLRDMVVQSHVDEFASVYECSDGTDRPEIPCPDYIVTAKLNGSAKDQPPTLKPARNAEGKIVIDFKSKWEPAVCFTASNGQRVCLPDRWDIKLVFADEAAPYATNQYDPVMDRWMGFKLFGIPSVMDDQLIPLGDDVAFEVYAGERYSDLKSPRLPADRIGF